MKSKLMTERIRQRWAKEGTTAKKSLRRRCGVCTKWLSGKRLKAGTRLLCPCCAEANRVFRVETNRELRQMAEGYRPK